MSTDDRPCRSRVKICGITSRRDALDAIALGADALGLNFYPPSPRALSPEHAAAITDALPPFVAVVGLFVNPSRAEVEHVLAAARLVTLQFHGTEEPGFCASFGLPYIKTIAMREGVDLAAAGARYAAAAALLLDVFDPVRWGGTGRSFDWARVPRCSPGEAPAAKPLVLAGGLHPGNVAAAVRRVRPYAVDVCGGVEAAPGVKDPRKVDAFIRSVHRASIDQPAA